MRVLDNFFHAKGIVSPSFLDVSTGRRIPFSRRNNMLSYMAAESVAAAFGGDPSYIPSRVGIIYGNSATFDSVITRNQSWGSLIADLRAEEGSSVDIQVVGFSYSPTLGGEKRASSSGSSGSSESEDDYSHILPTGSNAITFHAVSNSQESGVKESDAFHTGDYIYQCVLLGYHEGEYYVIARASLENFSESSSGGSSEGRYLRKPDGFEVAIDWTVVFH